MSLSGVEEMGGITLAFMPRIGFTGVPGIGYTIYMILKTFVSEVL